ncbi:substrate-binding periplasmic protein [Candidatus Venteria ishoeyi]|uniref:Cystine transporter subunit n=1 Tax=Candidatus Venteria ishoeyi TaxID=1899563 RepID=A0A1H6F5V5_9GAMM|nr:transporter substrate-binding domain-containing protein [Candidatus Venteria ishoeyi]MDM8546206.1 transporter substrate-binding domain-containing protein [Candidatus Venteria ishoeyi]SEH04375.1 cystine transporter subunit [Candidatus Venteria ishoeyi]
MYRILIIALCCLLPLEMPLAATSKLILNTSYTAPINAPDKSGVLDIFYQELFKRLGMEFEIQYLPAERALTNANKGIDDGDVCRILDLDKKYPNLVRVPEVVMQYEHVIFSRKADFKVTGPDDLKPYDVGVVKGWKIIEWNTTTANSVTLVDAGEQLFAMLADGRIDLAIIERMAGMMHIKAQELKDIHILEPAFLAGDWYLYLHKKHQDLVPIIDAEIRRMKADGSHQKIFNTALKRYQD